MGVSISKNVAKQLNATANNVASTYVDSCKGSIASDTGLNLDHCTIGSAGQPTQIDINSTNNISITCLQSNTLKVSMQNAITNAVNQQATAITQSLGLPSVAVATQIANTANELANSVVLKYTQQCAPQVNSNTTINCKDSTIYSFININSGNTEYTNCTQSNTGQIELINTLANQIGQTAAATEENSFNLSVAIILVVFAIVAIFLINTSTTIIAWIIVIIVILTIISIIVYAIIAQKTGLYPFPKK